MKMLLQRSRIQSALTRVFLLVIFLLTVSGCTHIVYYEGSYHGRVIDAQTREPIEGVVVLGVWSKAYMTTGGDVHEYYDARETLTDANGEFTIKGMAPRVMTHLEKMDIVIFKVGYEDVGLTSWDSLRSAIYYRDRVKWEGNKAIIPLDKWTLEQRKKRMGVRVVWVPIEKQTKLTAELEKEINDIKKLED